MKAQPKPSLTEVESARRRLAGGIRLTPCLPAPALSALVGINLRLKREDLQRTGSTKERGARHALLCLSDEARGRGVVAASTGNFAFGLAYHAGMLGIQTTIVLPFDAPALKITHCRSLGASVELYGTDLPAARAQAREIARRTGAFMLDPATDPGIASGQATLALEILEQAPHLGTLVVPVGGGLAAGITAVLRRLRPAARVIAVQRDTAGRAFPDGSNITVQDGEIAAATNLLACRAGIVADPLGAMPLAAVLAGRVNDLAGGDMVLVVCARGRDPREHASSVARGAEWLERTELLAG